MRLPVALDHVPALLALAAMYTKGQVTELNPAKGFDLLQRAASLEPSNASALYNIGLCYEQGLGVAKSEMKAAVYFSLTANQSNTGNALPPKKGGPIPSIAFLQSSEVLMREHAHRSQLESDYYREALGMALQWQQRPRWYTQTRRESLLV